MNRQRGVMVFLIPLVLVTIVLLGTLAIDGARLYSLRQEMQSQVNAAATAAADAAQACGGEEISLEAIRQRALVAARAQGFDGEEQELVVEPGVVENNDTEVLSFRPEEDLTQGNGLVVKLESKESISALLPGLLGEVTISAQTAVRKEIFATFYIESFTASVDTSNALLLGAVFNGVLGGNHISLDAVSLSSLSDTVVNLSALVDHVATETGLGVDEVLRSEVPANVVVGALGAADGVPGDAATIIDQVLSAGITTNLKFSEVINVVGNTGVPSGAAVPALEVLSSLVLNIAQTPPLNGVVAVSVDPLLEQLGLGELAGLSMELRIDEAPAVVVAPARRGLTDHGLDWLGQAHGADITLNLDASVDIGDPALSALTIKVPLELQTGAAKATLVSATCGAGRINAVDYIFQVEKSALQLSTDVDITVVGAQDPQPICMPGIAKPLCLIPPAETFEYRYTGLLTGIRYGDCCYPPPSCSGLIDIQVSSSSVSGGGVPSDTVEFRALPLHNFVPRAQSVGIDSGEVLSSTVNDLLNGISVVSAELACLPLESLLNLTLDLVRPAIGGVIEPLSDHLLGPLLEGLGVSLGKAEVHVVAAKQPSVQLLQYCGPEGC